MRSLELFTGGGGLALGLERAGFHHVALVEYDHDSCETLRTNSGGPCVRRRWPVYETDVREFHYARWAGKVELLAGGPPCQPFSIAGKHRGDTDHRNMFPEMIRAARALRPEAVLVENVYGLTREVFKPYLDYIVLQLRYPTVAPQAGEEWTDHKRRLNRLVEERAHVDLEYRVSGPRVMDLVDYGVPQIRKRLLIVALRSDMSLEWSWPEPTHSREALVYDQWVSGRYWQRHGVPMPEAPEAVAALAQRIGRLNRPHGKPWRTVRDALLGLPEPVDGQEHPHIANHVGIPGARAYYGHSGSTYDWPAKTLKAGGHGVPGGENMVQGEDGTVRYFTVRESARLQTFSDEYVFASSRSESMRQIGNAVPVLVGEAIGRSLRGALESVSRQRLRPQRRAPFSTEPLMEVATG